MLARNVRHGIVWVISSLTILFYRFMGIKIGKKTYVSINAHLDVRRGKIVIGDHVDIAKGACILSHMTGHKDEQGDRETVIEDNVKIFVNAVVLPGVRIGKNAIIGAGSVVMKDVPPNTVVLGNPARVVKQREPEK